MNPGSFREHLNGDAIVFEDRQAYLCGPGFREQLIADPKLMTSVRPKYWAIAFLLRFLFKDEVLGRV